LPSCFIIMPITTPPELVASYGNDPDHFEHVLEMLFVPAVSAIGYEPLRPSARGADLIHDEIIRQLETADLVLCDMSSLNANVFFELGIRTALDKPVSLVRDNYTARVPFDAGILNHHTYDAALNAWSLGADVAKLSEHLQHSIDGSDNRNTMWRRFGLTLRAEVPTEANSNEEKLDLLVREITALSNNAGPGGPRIPTMGSTRMGDFLDDVLTSLSSVELARIDLEPVDERIVTARPTGLARNRPPSDVEFLLKRVAEIGQRWGIKVNVRL
jgi:hypothetical protein